MRTDAIETPTRPSAVVRGPAAVAVWLRAGARPDVLLVAVIAIVYVIVQSHFLRVPDIGDQADYMEAAARLPDVTATHRHLRIGLLFPTRAAIAIFGYSEAAYRFVPYLAGLLLIGGTYALGRLWFNRIVAVAAGLLVMLNPMVLLESSHLLPDLFAARLFTVACALLVALGLRPEAARAGRGATALLVVAGVLLGWSYLVREFILMVFPVVVVIFLAYRINWRRMIPLALGALPVFALELLWGLIVYGDPIVRARAVFGRPAGSPGRLAQLEQLREAGAIGRPPGEILATFWRALSGGASAPLFAVLGLAFLIATALLRDRRFLVLMAWAGGLWAFLTFNGFLEDEYGGPLFLRIDKLRYWFPIFPPLLVGGVGAVIALAGRLGRDGRAVRSIGVAAVVALTGGTLWGGLGEVSDRASLWDAGGAGQYRDFRPWLASEGHRWSTISTDSWTARVLPIYTRRTLGTRVWDGSIERLDTSGRFIALADVLPGLVVIDTATLARLGSPRLGRDVPVYLTSPPADWRLVGAFADDRLLVYATG